MSANKKKKIMGVVLDPLPSLNVKKDSTLAMIEAAQKRNWDVYVMTLSDLFVEGSIPNAFAEQIEIDRTKTPFFKIHKRETRKLESFDIILMRKDPPFNMEYIHATSMLGLVDPKKTVVSNHPSSLRLFNEKFMINYAAEYMAPTLFTRNHEKISEFIREHKKVVVKPMDVMGGRGVFVINEKDSNRAVILETLTENFSKTIVVQRYLPEISNGDRRIFVIGGEPLSEMMIRKPSENDHRGNLDAGAIATFGKITETEKKIVASLKPFFLKNGLHFVGLDFIGSHITEINITSPTGTVQTSQHFGISIADRYLDYLESIQ